MLNKPLARSLLPFLAWRFVSPPDAVAQKLAPVCPNGVKVFYAHLGANGIIVSGFEALDAAARANNTGKVRALDVTMPERGAVLAIYFPGDSSRVKAACKGTDNR